jgi:3-dehydroquinate dehydratase
MVLLTAHQLIEKRVRDQVHRIAGAELIAAKGAVQKQKEFIAELHDAGAEVLMSTHSHKFLTADEVLKIAYGHRERGADICKIVAHAECAEQQIENMRIIDLLKRELDIPFLFLCGGECKILRRVGGEFGNCMSLCVSEYDELATTCQPLLRDMKILRELL